MPRRLLIVADDESDRPAAVPAAVRELGDVETARVLAPIIASRLDTLTEDDEAYRAAQRRADRLVEALREDGVEATGEYTTEDPYDAAVTAFQAGEYDAILVATTAEGHWREDDALERLRESTDVPVTEVEIHDGDA